ncbi:ABC transporter ATP-binding protein [Flexivirga meconopsidis]|uniref:ABC transporter ATP-binding protein n=1 Tax=Flexivirga meconopsidis TaxID=2977121 RepID=UPI00223F12A5|nr:ATP-binding cassette domain-containing protein [Flexivirga meconopsidis]
MTMYDEASLAAGVAAERGLPVRVTGLVHIYRADGHDVAALSGVDLTVPSGGMLALLGPSGAGKSTLLSILAGLVRPSAGHVFVGADDLTRLSDGEVDALRGQQVGLVMQGASRNLLPFLNVRQNVEYAQLAARRSGRTDLPDPTEVLELVGVDADDMQRPVDRVSAATRQLVALAAAIAPAPGLVLADEPTSALPSHDTELVVDALHRVNDNLGTTVVVVTHDEALASRMGRTLTIRDGRVGSEGRGGVELAVIGPDGSLPLPPHVLEQLPPGTLVRVDPVDEADPAAGWTVVLWQEGD